MQNFESEAVPWTSVEVLLTRGLASSPKVGGLISCQSNHYIKVNVMHNYFTIVVS